MIGQSKCLWLKDLERDERRDLVERGTRIDREATEMDEGALEACDKWKRKGGAGGHFERTEDITWSEVFRFRGLRHGRVLTSTSSCSSCILYRPIPPELRMRAGPILVGAGR